MSIGAARRPLRTLTLVVLALAGLLAAPAAGASDGRGRPPSHPRLDVVQMGDSYSAGNGTRTSYEKNCWRSHDVYGATVARDLRARFTNVACSGGVVKDLLNPRPLGAVVPKVATYRVSGRTQAELVAAWERRARAERLCGTAPQRDMFHTFTVASPVIVGRLVTATAQCQLTARAQIDAVGPATDVVLLTVGGNDVGFSGIVLSCLILRDAAGCERTLDDARAKTDVMADDVRAALTRVRAASRGHATIYLVSYPFLINTDSYGIPELAPTFDVGRALRDFQVRGDEVQRAAMASANARTRSSDFVFVDTVKAAWGGHRHSLDPRVVPDNSQAWLVPPFALGAELSDWVHPTIAGQDATASAVRSAVLRRHR